MPTVPPSSAAGREDRDLDAGPHHAQGVTARRDARHQAVAGTRAEARADVEAGRDAVEHDAGRRAATPRVSASVAGSNAASIRSTTTPTTITLRDRAEARLLLERDPEQQHERADDADPHAGAEADAAREALVQDVPRIGAEPGEQDERRAGPVEDESGVELGEASGHGASMPQVALDFSGQSSDHGSMAAPIAPAVLAELLGSGWRRHRGTADALADALRALVVDGRLAARTRVPSERALAPALGVGRGTVTRAYDRLREDGYLVSARGAGSWLTLPDGAPAARPRCRRSPRRGPRALDLSVAAPGRPGAAAERAAAAAAARAGPARARHGYAPAGLPELRAAVAARFTERGVPTTPEQILSPRRPARPAPRARAARARRPTACSSTRPPIRARSPRCAARGCVPCRAARRRGWDAEAGPTTVVAARRASP